MILIRRADGRLLVVRRAAGRPRAGYWSPPSGRIEAGEDAASAVRREAREELGLEVRPLRELARSRSDDGAFLLRWWEAEAVAGEPLPDPAEVAEWRWAAPAELPTLGPHFPEHLQLLADLERR